MLCAYVEILHSAPKRVIARFVPDELKLAAWYGTKTVHYKVTHIWLLIIGTVFIAHLIFRKYFCLTLDIRSNMTASLDQDRASFKPDSEQYLPNSTIPWLSVAKKLPLFTPNLSGYTLIISNWKSFFIFQVSNHKLNDFWTSIWYLNHNLAVHIVCVVFVSQCLSL